jgi:hypothetical protein
MSTNSSFIRFSSETKRTKDMRQRRERGKRMLGRETNNERKGGEDSDGMRVYIIFTCKHRPTWIYV